MTKSVFTCGDVNGIGPEIVIKTLNRFLPKKNRKLIFVCPKNIFEFVSEIVPPKFEFNISKSLPTNWESNQVQILDIGNVRYAEGKPTRSSGKASYKSIVTSCDLANRGIVDSIITAPISKFAFKKAHIDFPGHTELLANYFNVKKFAMMFVSKRMKAALVSIHIPLKDVSKSLNQKIIQNTISIIDHSLKSDFGIKNPKIAILGLNPHAGEDGNIGTEEKIIIRPVLNKKERIDGPFVPDAYFGNRIYNNYDCTIGMYHDQILIPFKLLNFNRGVNYTAGLPIIRTSPDHGTAFDIAGKFIANPDSMIEAFRYSELIYKNRKKNKV